MKIESEEFWEDQEWGFKHYSELVRKYPDKWVAIVNKRVIVAGGLESVEEESRKKTGKTNIPLIFVDGGSHIY
jgi:hypothetical protein